MSLDYYVSERFIHDDLVKRCEVTVNQVYDLWKRDGRLDPIVLAWPAEPIRDDNGVEISDVCALTLPQEEAKRPAALRAFVDRTKAYGLLLGEQYADHVKLILETPHGTRAWTIPILKSGDAKILGKVRYSDDNECVGLLWRKEKSLA